MNKKRLKSGLMLILGLALVLTSTVLAADGDLDTTFDNDGWTTTDFGSNDEGMAVALQSDGKIVVAGNSNNDFAVARYNRSGSLDTSFDYDGMLSTDLTGSNSEEIARAVAIQSDGKIVVAGRSHTGSNYDFAVVRYNHDGTLDTTFGDDGIVTTDFNNSEDYGNAMAIQSDGKIIVTGYVLVSGHYDFAAIRYNSDGSLDTSFDTDGKVSTDINGKHDYAKAVALQSDGKIVVVGNGYINSSQDFALVRYNSDGSLDSSFDTDGKVSTDINDSTNYGQAVALQADGKIVVAGNTEVDSYDFSAVRYNNDGSLDNSFSGDGKVITSISGYDQSPALAIQSDGKIVLVGYNGNGDFVLVRYLSDGSTDNTFSGDGILTTDLGDSIAYAATIQPDGKIVAAGRSGSDFAVVRYQNGSLLPLQTLIDAANSNDTITLDADTTYTGGTTVNKSLTIDLNGATVGAGSPAFTITASDVTILNGTLDGGGDASPAILVQSGGDNFALQDVDVTDWADGVEVAADVTSLKVVGNYFHDLVDAGLQINSGVALAGVVSVEGNLFKNNGGNGIQNDGTTALSAQYNAWGDINGATAGDGVSGNVDASNATFSELFVAVNPGTEDQSRTVAETEQFNVALNVDAASLYGVQYQLSYDANLLTLDSATDGSFRGTGQCTTQTGTPGEITLFCTRHEPDENANGTPITISELTFTPNVAGLTGSGPWSQHFDLSSSESQLLSGARGGVTVYVNNGGFGEPSQAGLRTITDAEDGQIVITLVSANVTGFINLEGRLNDDNATIQLYDQEALSGATELANGSSASDGSVTSAHLDSHLLRLNQTYYLQVDAPLYLPTTAASDTNFQHSVNLDTAPLTTFSTLTLLGGDASNDNTISLADATCIGNDFGTSTSTCTGSGASSDVTGDGEINLIDLVLMGGNYERSSSSWTP